MLLTLPAVAPDVPAVIEFGCHNERHLRLALAMSRAGMMQDELLKRQRRSNFDSRALVRLIETGWLREIGPLFEFKAISMQATLVIPSGERGMAEEFANENGDPRCAVVFNAGSPTWFAVGDVIERLEARHQGLGRKALNILDLALRWWCHPFTPSGAFDMARMLYWQGEDDETSAIAEYQSMGEDASDVWKRSEIFQGIPEWAFNCTRKKPKLLSDRGFARIARELSKATCGPLLDALSRLNAFFKKADGHKRLPDPPREFQCTEPMAVLHWRGNDELGRVFDDFWQFESQGEQDPYLGTIAFSLNENDLTEALLRVRHTGLMLRTLDEALVALSALGKPKGKR